MSEPRCQADAPLPDSPSHAPPAPAGPPRAPSRAPAPRTGQSSTRVSAFVRAHPDCFLRSCREGHITGSAWILSADHRQALLTHHRKLDRWLQLGGHSDGESDPRQVALREAQEESGLARFRFLPEASDPLPLDLDVHPIPAFGGEPAHLHLDVRFLLVAEAGQAAARERGVEGAALVRARAARAISSTRRACCASSAGRARSRRFRCPKRKSPRARAATPRSPRARGRGSGRARSGG